jgi:stage V sporulation protein B
MDRLVLAYLVDLSTVGIYNYAILVASASLFVVSPFGTVLVPRISALFARQESAAIRKVTPTSISLLALIYVPVALGLAAISPFFLGALVGPGYDAASLPLAILLVLTAVTIPYAILGSLAAGIRRTPALMKASGLALLANVAVSVVLVPRIGMAGAALGNSAMSWVPFLVLYLELRKTGLIQFDQRSLAGIWGAALVMGVSVAVPVGWLGYRPVLAPPFLAIGVGVFALMLRYVRAVTPDMAAALVHALPRWAEFLRPAVAWFVAVDPAGPTPRGGV